MGSDGGYGGSTTSEPWKAQGKYLEPLFKIAFGGTTGQQFNPDFDDTLPISDKNQKYIPLSGWAENFFDKDKKQPGELDYFGTTDLNKRDGKWKPTSEIIDKYTDTETGSPTIVDFTDEQKTAQDAAESLAKSRIGNQNSLLGKSETELGKIITGANEIPYHDIQTPQIGDPGEVTGQKINYNPAMQAADLNFRDWGSLNELSGGEGGNAYLDDMVTAATRGLRNRYLTDVVPDINSAAEDAGARGSGAWADLRSQAGEDYLTSAGDVEANIRGNAFGNQLQAQLGALGLSGDLAGKTADYTQDANKTNTQLALQKAMTEAGYGQEANMTNVSNDLTRFLEQAGISGDINKQNALLKTQTDTQNIQNRLNSIFGVPDINKAGYDDIGVLSTTGAEKQDMGQKVLDSYIQKEEQQNMEPWNRASLWSQLIGGNFGGTMNQSAKSGGK